MNSDLQIALDNLKKDDVVLRLAETGEEDNYFVIYSKHWKTKFGVNDLGFWLVEQIPKNSKQNQ